jgi:hypothetical protein
MVQAAVTTKRITSYVIDADHKPGVLAKFMKGMKDGGADLMGVWAFATIGESAKIHCIPWDEKKFLESCKKMGHEPRPRTTFYITGENKVGALTEALDKIAAAGISFRALDAISIGDKFRAYIWGDRTNTEAIGKALGV